MINSPAIEIGLNAAIVAVMDHQPMILCIPGAEHTASLALPSGPFDPPAHRTMELGLRGFVEEQASLKLGYIEQLYTFGDRGRHQTPGDPLPHMVSVGYLALTQLSEEKLGPEKFTGGKWKNWYQFLPWEDWRGGKPVILDEVILPALNKWVETHSEKSPKLNPRTGALSPSARLRMAFGLDGAPWEDELVLERYELLYSARLLEEVVFDGHVSTTNVETPLGITMMYDHRRILATAISRLRSKLRYRPVIFELMTSEFTLLDLQLTAESIFGRPVHKQNFRRTVEKAHLVEATGATSLRTGGRPAALFRFRRDIIEERPMLGLRVGRG
ncbi:MAG: NAD regulator [Rhizobiaceae bacterium]|nr:NAD regulator [Rhizobiaceae bacterium]